FFYKPSPATLSLTPSPPRPPSDLRRDRPGPARGRRPAGHGPRSGGDVAGVGGRGPLRFAWAPRCRLTVRCALSGPHVVATGTAQDRKSTRLNSSHDQISYAVFCLK